MYFERKNDAYFDEWLHKERKSPLLLVDIW